MLGCDFKRQKGAQNVYVKLFSSVMIGDGVVFEENADIVKCDGISFCEYGDMCRWASESICRMEWFCVVEILDDATVFIDCGKNGVMKTTRIKCLGRRWLADEYDKIYETLVARGKVEGFSWLFERLRDFPKEMFDSLVARVVRDVREEGVIEQIDWAVSEPICAEIMRMIRRNNDMIGLLRSRHVRYCENVVGELLVPLIRDKPELIGLLHWSALIDPIVDLIVEMVRGGNIGLIKLLKYNVRHWIKGMNFVDCKLESEHYVKIDNMIVEALDKNPEVVCGMLHRENATRGSLKRVMEVVKEGYDVGGIICDERVMFGLYIRILGAWSHDGIVKWIPMDKMELLILWMWSDLNMPVVEGIDEVYNELHLFWNVRNEYDTEIITKIYKVYSMFGSDCRRQIFIDMLEKLMARRGNG